MLMVFFSEVVVVLISFLLSVSLFASLKCSIKCKYRCSMQDAVSVVEDILLRLRTDFVFTKGFTLYATIHLAFSFLRKSWSLGKVTLFISLQKLKDKFSAFSC